MSARGERGRGGGPGVEAVDVALPDRVCVREARAEEAALLTEIALRSKAHWGYDPEFLRDCRRELTVTQDFILVNHVYVAEAGTGVVGFYSLKKAEGGAELDELFVEPEAIGKGVGRLLWRHALGRARRSGWRRLIIHADPHAEPFYLKMGAKRVGVAPSAVRHDRMLPLLHYELD